MSPREIWCNEAQERYVLAIAPASLDRFRAICERERCPFAVVGSTTAEPRLVVTDRALGSQPVDMDLGVLLGKPPRMTREAVHLERELPPFDARQIELADAAFRVLQLPSVADKTFLVTIGDRTVGGLSARDPMVGPWQVPVADVAATLLDFDGYAGEAMAIGERTPLALIDAPASGRMAIGEALTNIAAAAIDRLRDVKLSANWMAPAGHPGEDAALYDTVRAVALDLCPALGVSIPVGKDSMSMRTAWRDGGVDKAVTAPVSLIVSAFAAIADARRVLTPELRTDVGSVLLLVDLGNGKNRLGGSALAQVYGQLGNVAPDVDDPAALAAFFATVQALHAQHKLLAYHDRSDGGLFVTLFEMAVAARCGLAVCIDELPGSAAEALFNEELGAVLQVRAADRHDVVAAFEAAGLRCICVGEPSSDGRIRILGESVTLFEASRVELHRAWSATTHALQRMRDNPASADQEYERISDAEDPGLAPMLGFDPAEDIAAPYISTGVRPRVAVLREQGVNGQVELAAAFDRAGFAAYDVHMSDVIAGRETLAGFAGLAGGGGFSYGDVLGAGEGWAKSILFNARARDAFAAFFERGDTFALGICNGCQMMSNLHELIPGSEHWPHFVRNRSEQFEARLILLEVQPSPSLFFAGMEGSRIPVALAHGEGYAEFRDAGQQAAAEALVTLRFVDNRGAATERYPYNPNGSPQRHHRIDDGRRTFFHIDAASGARIPHRADVVASRRMGRGLAVDAHVPQRAALDRLRADDAVRIDAIAAGGCKADESLGDQRRDSGRRSELVRARYRCADRRCHCRPRLLCRTGGIAARRLWPHRASRRLERAGFMRDARISRHRYRGRRQRTCRSWRDSAWLRCQGQRADRDERRDQRQRGDRRILHCCGDGVRQGRHDRAAAHAGCRRAGKDRTRADRTGACLESRGDAELSGADAPQPRDNAPDRRADQRRARTPAHRAP